MELEGTPGPPRDQEFDGAVSPGSRIQPGMSGSSSPVFPENSRAESRNVAEVVPIRANTVGAEQEPDSHIPVWMQRANLVMRFLICVWIDMILTILPWTLAWTQNALIESLPKLRAIFALNYVRGMVTGIGLLDIWIGIWEAVHYHDQRPTPRT